MLAKIASFFRNNNLLISGFAALFAFGICVVLYQIYRGTPCLTSLPWDPASHALDGLRLRNNALTLSPLSFAHSLMSMVWWPPVPALMMLPFFLLPGGLQHAHAYLSLFCLFGLLVFPAWFFSRCFGANIRGTLCTRQELISYGTYFSFSVSCLILLKFSILSMYEVPGAFLTLIAVCSYWVALDLRANGRDFTRAYMLSSVTLLILLLTKWNYGLQLLLVGIGVEILLSKRDGTGTSLITNARLIFVLRHYKTLNGIVFLLLVVVSWIAVTGGGQYVLVGVKISATALPNPLLILVYFIFLRGYLGFRCQRGNFIPLAPVHSILLKYTAAPYSIWLMYPVPNRFNVLLRHLKGTGEGPELNWGRFQYYWNYISHDYFLSTTHVVLFAICLVLVSFGLFGARKSWGARMAASYFLWAFFSTLFLSSTRDDRMLINFMPVGFLLAAWALGRACGLSRWGYALALALPLTVFLSR